MGLYKRGAIYWCEWQIGGQRVRETTGTSRKEEAKEYHDRRRAELWRAAKLGERPAITWDEALQAWLTEHACHKATYADDLWRLRWIQPRLTGQRIDAISTSSLIELREAKRAESSVATANRHLAIISAVLHHAHAKGEINGVPKIPYQAERREHFRFLSHEQAEALLAELPEHLAVMARFALATGLRRANVTGLRWENIDLGRRIAWVWPEDSKSGKPLGVPLNDAAVAVLRAQLGQHAVFVFTFRHRTVRETGTYAWKKACERAGVAGLRWHDLRHTWASWHVQAGTPLEVLQRLGGWASYEMVLRYAHLAPDYAARWAGNIGAVRPSPHEIPTAESGEDTQGLDYVGWAMGLEPTTTGITNLKQKSKQLKRKT